MNSLAAPVVYAAAVHCSRVFSKIGDEPLGHLYSAWFGPQLASIEVPWSRCVCLMCSVVVG